MAIRTSIVHGHSSLSSVDRKGVESAFSVALDALEKSAEKLKAEVAWDTLEVVTDVERIETSTFHSSSSTSTEHRTLRLEAQSFRHV